MINSRASASVLACVSGVADSRISTRRAKSVEVNSRMTILLNWY
jgi:hypothetical protein